MLATYIKWNVCLVALMLLAIIALFWDVFNCFSKKGMPAIERWN